MDPLRRDALAAVNAETEPLTPAELQWLKDVLHAVRAGYVAYRQSGIMGATSEIRAIFSAYESVPKP